MRFRKIAAALLTLALGFCLCQPAAFAATAADQHTQLQELPVSIQSCIHSCRSFRFPFSPRGKHLSQRKH